MKKVLFPILFFFGSSAYAQLLQINQFSGINTDDSAITLQSGQSPDSRNVLTDDGPGVQGRKGFIRFSTEPSSGLYEFPLTSGTRYLITRSGTSMKATSGDGIFNIVFATVPTDRPVVGAVLGDKFFFSDTLNGLRYWNASTTTLVSSSLTFDKLVTFKGRLAGAGIANDARTIYLSKYLDGTSFNLVVNPSDDDPTRISVAGSLDEAIQALYSTYQDKLMYFKKNSFGGLSGSRRSNFALRIYSDSIGVSSIETIRDCDGKLRWLGNNRKVYQFDGATFGIISEDIDNIMVNVAQGDSNPRSFPYTTQSDFGGGSVDVVYGDTTTIPGSLTFTFPEHFDSYRNGTSGTKPVWVNNANASVSSSFMTLTSNSQILTDLISVSSFSNTAIGTTYYITVASITNTSAFASGTSQLSLIIGNDLSGAITNGILRFTFSPNFLRDSSNLNQGLELQTVVEDGNSKCPSGCQSSSITLPGTIQIYTSSTSYRVVLGTGTMTGTLSDPSTDRPITLRYTYEFVDPNTFLSGPNPGIVKIDEFSLFPQTMTYTSSVIDLGPNIVTYTSFDAVKTGTNIGYQFNSSSNSTSNLFISTSFSGISSGQAPTNPVKRYAIFKSTFVASSTDVVSLDQIVINTNEGSNIHSASAYINSRYWLGVAISSTSNNAVLVYDKQNQWQRYDGYVPEVMSLYNSRMYFGNTNGIFLSESGYADNGSAITAYYKTKTFAPAGFDYFGQYSYLYLTTDNSDSILTPTFQINDSGTDNSFGSSAMSVQSGIQNLKYPFSSSGVQEGKFISMKWSATGSTFWRILNGSLYFTPSANPD